MRFLVLLLLSPLFLLAEAWAFMVLVGVVHGEWLSMLPTIDLASSLLVFLTFTLLTCTCALAYGVGKGVMDE